jgi:hypothetical protein
MLVSEPGSSLWLVTGDDPVVTAAGYRLLIRDVSRLSSYFPRPEPIVPADEPRA